jgi:hypothetical protein
MIEPEMDRLTNMLRCPVRRRIDAREPGDQDREEQRAHQLHDAKRRAGARAGDVAEAGAGEHGEAEVEIIVVVNDGAPLEPNEPG